MNIETLNSINKLETQREGLINLDALSFEFCDEDVVRTSYDEKFHSLEDKEKWIEENKDKLEQIKDRIAKSVEDGLIKDSQHGTIWQFKVDRAKEEQEKVLEIKSELEGRIDEMKDETVKRLSRFLPDWSSDKAKIIFTMNEKADFCIDRNIITVDLGRLLFEQNPIERVKEGIAHEIFHHWMSEKSEWLDSKQGEASNQALKNQIVFETVDEGLAVLVSGLSLEKHHIDQGRNFTEYTKQSFNSFKYFLLEDNRDKLERYKDEEFKNMGHFYVVGNEIAVAILQNDGIEKFRKLIVEIRDNSSVFLQRYREICKENTELLKIDL